jgi:hypothetical protein
MKEGVVVVVWIYFRFKLKLPCHAFIMFSSNDPLSNCSTFLILLSCRQNLNEAFCTFTSHLKNLRMKNELNFLSKVEEFFRILSLNSTGESIHVHDSRVLCLTFQYVSHKIVTLICTKSCLHYMALEFYL